MGTEYKISMHAHPDRPDSRRTIRGEAVPAAVVIPLQIGKRTNMEHIRLTVREARLLAENLLSAARMLEEHP